MNTPPSAALPGELEALTAATRQAIAAGRPGYTLERAGDFLRFRDRIGRELLGHRALAKNRYTAWFREGAASEAQLRAFIVQFSVFSNQFLIAQANKMINADTLEGMRASKEILANELGVAFTRQPGAAAAAAEAFDPDRNGTEGSVQGGVFRFEAGHFEWLWTVAQRLGLRYEDIGRRRHGTQATLFFCDELIRLYGADDYEISQAASYAIENWAAAGFWSELIEGFKRYNDKHGTHIPVGFFVWHDRLESQHARHTQEELEEYYFQSTLDEDAFLRHGNDMLDAVVVFWEGLEEQRRALEPSIERRGA